MANPSLQIGNDNWAIKEDNLLGYSTAGTRFVPQPITMTRATLGTRVNPSGLVETVELLGSELVTNGDFATDSSWIKGTGWSIAGGNATLAVQAASSSLSSNTMSVTVGKLYKITINVSATSSGFRLYDSLGVVSYGLPLGESVFYRTPSSSIYTVTPLGLAGASGIVTSVSVKEYQANDLARVDYTDGTSSLLVEPQRTNLVTYSEDFTANEWSKTGAVVTPNQAISPDGTLNADLVELGTVNDRFADVISSPSGGTYTFTFYIKAKEGQSGNWTSYCIGDTSSSTVTFIDDSAWVRVSKTFIKTGAGNLIVYPAYRLNSNTIFDAYIWGAQLEVGSYATSYIPNFGTSSGVTRVQETYEKTGISDLINSEEGVLFVEMAALSDDSTDRRITMSDGTTQNRMAIGFDNASNKIKYFLISSNTIQVNKDISVSNITQFNKIAFKYKLNDFALWVNGVEVDTDTSGSTFSANTLSVLRFAGYLGTSQNFYGKVKQLQIFKTALTDSELATLTS